VQLLAHNDPPGPPEEWYLPVGVQDHQIIAATQQTTASIPATAVSGQVGAAAGGVEVNNTRPAAQQTDRMTDNSNNQQGSSSAPVQKDPAEGEPQNTPATVLEAARSQQQAAEMPYDLNQLHDASSLFKAHSMWQAASPKDKKRGVPAILVETGEGEQLLNLTACQAASERIRLSAVRGCTRCTTVHSRHLVPATAFQCDQL
jgi:hypothetical protein